MELLLVIGSIIIGYMIGYSIATEKHNNQLKELKDEIKKTEKTKIRNVKGRGQRTDGVSLSQLDDDYL